MDEQKKGKLSANVRNCNKKKRRKDNSDNCTC